MTILETALCTILLVVLIYSGYTDCTSSQISNKLILLSGSAALVINVLYYVVFAGEYLKLFATNLIMIAVVGFVFYAYHLWAAGDCKLILVVGLCIPGRFYSFWDIGSAPAFVIFILVFSLAFLYVIVESFFLGLKNKDLLKLSFKNIDYVSVLLSYFSMVSVIMLINWGIWKLFAKALNDNLILSMAVSFLVVLSLSQIRNRLSKQELLYVTLTGWTAVGVLVFTKQYSLNLTADYQSWIMVLILMFLRMVAEKYNYRTIPTQSLKCGQILSAGTVLSFLPSKVQGLPTGTTEDLRSRLTQAEVDSIKRWESSKYGKPFVVIVRKIPFAIFIGVGTIVFIILEVAMQ